MPQGSFLFPILVLLYTADVIKLTTHHGLLAHSYGMPKGSFLFPILVLLYTADVIKFITHHGLLAHSYADDTQLRFHEKAHRLKQLLSLKACATDIGKVDVIKLT